MFLSTEVGHPSLLVRGDCGVTIDGGVVLGGATPTRFPGGDVTRCEREVGVLSSWIVREIVVLVFPALPTERSS